MKKIAILDKLLAMKSDSFEGWSEDAQNGYLTAIATINNFVHSSQFHPTSTEINEAAQAISRQQSPFKNTNARDCWIDGFENAIQWLQNYQTQGREKHMEITDRVRMQVDEPKDLVSPYFIKVKEQYSGTPMIEAKFFKNSNEIVSILKIDDKTVAMVLETRTEFNHVEYVFAQLPVVSKIESAVGDLWTKETIPNDFFHALSPYAHMINRGLDGDYIRQDEVLKLMFDAGISGANWQAFQPNPAIAVIERRLKFIKNNKMYDNGVDASKQYAIFQEFDELLKQIKP